MVSRKKSALKKSSSKEFRELISQSSAARTAAGLQPPKRAEPATFNSKFIFLLALWVLRVLVVFTPQNGYIQPDEFFQFTEPIAGDALDVESHLVWEFNQTAPLRSMFFPALFSLPVFSLLKRLYTTGDSVNVSPYYLLVGPRLLMSLASLLTDFSVYRLCRHLYAPGPSCKSPWSAKTIDCLLVHASSYLAFTYFTHTFSNTVETILFGLLLVLVVESLRRQNGHTITFAKIGTLLVLGFFNRPTFAIFAAVPLLYWLSLYATLNLSKTTVKSSRSSWSTWAVNGFKNAASNSFNLLIPVTLTAALLILLDTGYHRGFDQLLISLSEVSLTNLAEQVVVTPINFVLYNSQTANLANHGLHPFWFHALVCMPWSFTFLAIIFYFDLVSKVISHISLPPRLSVTNPTTAVLYLSILVSLALFSSRPHQEPRFLLPLVIPLVCLFGHRLLNYRLVSLLWFIVNFVLVIFYGHIHQAGVVPSLSHLHATIQKTSTNLAPMTVIFARQYLPPRHLLALPKATSGRITIHDLATVDFPGAFEETFSSVSPSLISNQLVYLSLPSCLTRQLKSSLEAHFPSISPILEYQHFPHFSAEELANSVSTFFDGSGGADSSSRGSSIFSALVHLHESFSMNIWKLTYKNNTEGNN